MTYSVSVDVFMSTNLAFGVRPDQDKTPGTFLGLPQTKEIIGNQYSGMYAIKDPIIDFRGLKVFGAHLGMLTRQKNKKDYEGTMKEIKNFTGTDNISWKDAAEAARLIGQIDEKMFEILAASQPNDPTDLEMKYLSTNEFQKLMDLDGKSGLSQDDIDALKKMVR